MADSTEHEAEVLSFARCSCGWEGGVCDSEGDAWEEAIAHERGHGAG